MKQIPGGNDRKKGKGKDNSTCKDNSKCNTGILRYAQDDDRKISNGKSNSGGLLGYFFSAKSSSSFSS